MASQDDTLKLIITSVFLRINFNNLFVAEKFFVTEKACQLVSSYFFQKYAASDGYFIPYTDKDN